MKTATKTPQTALILIALAALLFRLVYVLSLGNSVQWPDEREYHFIAVSLIEGKGYSAFRDFNATACGPTAYRAPALPAVMAALYVVFGPNLQVARIFQAIIGTLLVVLAYLICTELGYPSRAGLLAALVVSVYPYYIYCVGALYPITITAVLVATAVLLLLKGRNRTDVKLESAAGFSLGAAALAFGHVVASMPFVAFWIARLKLKNKGLGTTAFLVAFILVVTPWIVRNKIMLGRPVLSTAFAYNLCFGNHPQAKWDSGSRISKLVYPELEKHTASMREGEAADLYMKIGIRQIRERPVRFLVLSLGKAANFWRLYPNPAAKSVGLTQKMVGALTYGPAFLLGIVWFLLDRRRMALNWLMLLFPISWMAVAAVTVSVDRYRLPADIYLIVLASAAVDWWLASRGAKRG
ncbi:MAG: glycosyltransferase family 39 protein [Armatimonadetes bacterium]|nr:glycosyltransferase family 39 protein [Armatimonadota bacterium]